MECQAPEPAPVGRQWEGGPCLNQAMCIVLLDAPEEAVEVHPTPTHSFPNAETKAETIQVTCQNSSQLEVQQGLEVGTNWLGSEAAPSCCLPNHVPFSVQA